MSEPQGRRNDAEPPRVRARLRPIRIRFHRGLLFAILASLLLWAALIALARYL
jgi:hypothetical protein